MDERREDQWKNRGSHSIAPIDDWSCRSRIATVHRFVCAVYPSGKSVPPELEVVAATRAQIIEQRA